MIENTKANGNLKNNKLNMYKNTCTFKIAFGYQEIYVRYVFFFLQKFTKYLRKKCIRYFCFLNSKLYGMDFTVHEKYETFTISKTNCIVFIIKKTICRHFKTHKHIYNKKIVLTLN